MLGVPTISSTFGLAVSMQLLRMTANSWLPGSVLTALLQLLALALVADFGLYWGERRWRRDMGRVVLVTAAWQHPSTTAEGACCLAWQQID